MTGMHGGGEYETAHGLMDVMVRTSQRPLEEGVIDEGNLRFVETVGEYLDDRGYQVRTVGDPEYSNRALLVVDVGDPNGEQVLSTISHSDVVSVKGQDWKTDPWELIEKDGLWVARGVCDTHGSGVAMLQAAQQDDVVSSLRAAGKRVSIVFTSDEEAAEAYWSYRGARLAVGELGIEPTITSKYFIAGEPTEPDTEATIIARRAHKGRWLAKFGVGVERPGHSAEDVQNALDLAIEVGYAVGRFSAEELRSTAAGGEQAAIFNPPYSTARITGGDIKSDAFSTTPSKAALAVDLRTLPGVHDAQVEALSGLIRERAASFGEGVSLTLEEIDNFAGTSTPADSPIVVAAQEATGYPVMGFNGGDEGEVMRKHGKEGVTIGPGKLGFAHQANEQIEVSSIFKAAKIYSDIFRAAAQME